jgi:hypothetical protein
MNTPILARVDQSDAVGQGSRRKLSSPRPESRRAKLLATTLAAPILASMMLLSPGGEATNAGRALLYPTGHLALVAAAHVRGITHRDASGSHKATTHGPLLAGKHVAHIMKGAG